MELTEINEALPGTLPASREPQHHIADRSRSIRITPCLKTSATNSSKEVRESDVDGVKARKRVTWASALTFDERPWSLVGPRIFKFVRGVPYPPKPEAVKKQKENQLWTRKQRCFKCLERGHLISSCRNPWVCLLCKKVGHRRASCSSVTKSADMPPQARLLGKHRRSTSREPSPWRRRRFPSPFPTRLHRLPPTDQDHQSARRSSNQQRRHHRSEKASSARHGHRRKDHHSSDRQRHQLGRTADRHGSAFEEHQQSRESQKSKSSDTVRLSNQGTEFGTSTRTHAPLLFLPATASSIIRFNSTIAAARSELSRCAVISVFGNGHVGGHRRSSKRSMAIVELEGSYTIKG